MATAEKKAILFVDDEPSVLSCLRRLMRKENRNLLFAQSGMEGLGILKNQEVDVVVSDMRMPQMDGATFLKQVLEFYPGTIRIMLTGYADRASVTQAFAAADIYEVVSKPWDDDKLKQLLRDALEHSNDHEHARPDLHKIINEIDPLPPDYL
ncbi:MAG TPA: response regulator [Candidatus Handelsmanbacteria bacterium]|nr:response regulator [Candidatus Handelsmanbacteria bacterium]HIK80225.1 response regulator [Porticoccaceae bacterium]